MPDESGLFCPSGDSAKFLQKYDYYAFGKTIGRVDNNQNHYLYNKKELQDGWNVYDYGARFFDHEIARSTTIDPFAEKSRRWSPYNYCEDNPIRNIDFDGDTTITIHQTIQTGQKLSPTFSSLLKSENINTKDYRETISFGTQTATNNDNGKITLTKGDDPKFQIIKLTQELTNKSNLSSI